MIYMQSVLITFGFEDEESSSIKVFRRVDGGLHSFCGYIHGGGKYSSGHLRPATHRHELLPLQWTVSIYKNKGVISPFN